MVQDIQQAVVSQSTREEIERAVCDRFVELDTYEFAWVGTAELPDRTLTPSTSAGNADGYLDEVTVQLQGGEQSRLGGEAIRSGRTQIVSDVSTDDRFVPWREAALSRGFHSVAAIPLMYRQTTFGLLAVYAGEPNAFAPGVRDVFDTLGQLIGHAIMSATQRQALHSDLVTEVELQIDGIGDLFEFDAPFSDRIRFDRMIPVSGGQFLMYASLPTDDVDTLRAADVVESVTRLGEDGSESRVEITWNDPPISTLVSAFGGRIRGGVLDESSVVTTVEFPQTVEVNAVVEQLESNYPALRVSLQRRATLEPAGTDADDALSQLTERQRDALEAAYFGGYFEWPRERSAADLADSMGIADPTFHQHLRSAERQAFSRLLDDTGQKR
ncbi:bacterio-opsin activator domain-containing protein [Haloarcula sediminis]|uniref:bacterio-opsin activator domain-containing protein n=1 Tax=Haloarcula sediminis TaxID=3111777 RepID=UPI002D79F0FB|nr:bacterio-opsin activator domain-containing protein [Haloarcula sp. CK38]